VLDHALRRLALRLAAGTGLILVGLTAGCGTDAGQPPAAIEEPPTPCYALVDYPVPAVDELIGELGTSVGQEHMLTDYRLAPNGLTCAPTTADVSSEPCDVVRGDPEVMSGQLLGRSIDALTDQLFAEGATRFTTADLTMVTPDGADAFYYRMTEVRFADAGQAATAAPSTIASECGGAAQPSADFGGAPRWALVDGPEPFLVVQQDGARLIVVQARLGDVTSELLPADAMDTMVRWYAAVTA
jgi:hypothetical protein